LTIAEKTMVPVEPAVIAPFAVAVNLLDPLAVPAVGE